MGLDIYFATVKDTKAYKKLATINKKLSKLDKKYEANHPELNKAFNIWQNWYYLPKKEKAMVEEPKYEYYSYRTPEEVAEYAPIEDELKKYKEASSVSKDIDELCMNNQNWMLEYVYARHPEQLNKNKDIEYALKDGECLLSIEDVEELVSRMEKVVSNWKEFDGEMTDKDGKYSDKYKSFYGKLIEENRNVAEELLPTSKHFFLGPIDYDWHYYISIKRYCEAFKETLKKMTAESLTLRYTEIW